MGELTEPTKKLPLDPKGVFEQFKLDAAKAGVPFRIQPPIPDGVDEYWSSTVELLVSEGSHKGKILGSIDFDYDPHDRRLIVRDHRGKSRLDRQGSHGADDAWKPEGLGIGTAVLAYVLSRLDVVEIVGESLTNDNVQRGGEKIPALSIAETFGFRVVPEKTSTTMITVRRP